jgi:hypothetical protein
MPYRLVYPDGQTAEREEELPSIGYDVEDFRVDFISHANEPPTVYLGLHYGQVDLVRLIYFVVGGATYPLTVAESAELAERMRVVTGGRIDSVALPVAVRLDQLIEESTAKTPEMAFLPSEEAALPAAWRLGRART